MKRFCFILAFVALPFSANGAECTDKAYDLATECQIDWNEEGWPEKAADMQKNPKSYSRDDFGNLGYRVGRCEVLANVFPEISEACTKRFQANLEKSFQERLENHPDKKLRGFGEKRKKQY